MEKKSCKKGFTLLEFLIVIIILSIIGAYAMSRWPGDTINLNAEAQQLANMVRYTQSLSFAQGQRYRLNLTSTGYSITNLTGTIVIDPVQGDSSIAYSSGITQTLANLPNNLIAFDGMGTPYTDSTATTLLAANALIALKKGGRTRTVSITPTTGRVIVQ